jgi:penicillin-insensitive murein endopeptidase
LQAASALLVVSPPVAASAAGWPSGADVDRCLASSAKPTPAGPDHRTPLSVGSPYGGTLRHGVALPSRGPGYVTTRWVQQHDARWGTAELVALVQRTAATMRCLQAGAPLVVGHLSLPGGGDIELSRSHNSGRDVDFAFPSVDAAGQPTLPPYHPFGPDGRSRRAPRRFALDLRATWLLFDVLAAQSEPAVQWIVVSPDLERLVLGAARAAGVDAARIRRAEALLTLPDYGGAHDNHVHVRIGCPLASWRAGCQPAGPVRAHEVALEAAMTARWQRLRPRLFSPRARTRAEAISALARAGLVAGLEDVVASLADPDAGVGAAARKALDELAVAADVAQIDALVAELPALTGAKVLQAALERDGRGRERLVPTWRERLRARDGADPLTVVLGRDAELGRRLQRRAATIAARREALLAR